MSDSAEVEYLLAQRPPSAAALASLMAHVLQAVHAALNPAPDNEMANLKRKSEETFLDEDFDAVAQPAVLRVEFGQNVFLDRCFEAVGGKPKPAHLRQHADG